MRGRTFARKLSLESLLLDFADPDRDNVKHKALEHTPSHTRRWQSNDLSLRRLSSLKAKSV